MKLDGSWPVRIFRWSVYLVERRPIPQAITMGRIKMADDRFHKASQIFVTLVNFKVFHIGGAEQLTLS